MNHQTNSKTIASYVYAFQFKIMQFSEKSSRSSFRAIAFHFFRFWPWAHLHSMWLQRFPRGARVEPSRTSTFEIWTSAKSWLSTSLHLPSPFQSLLSLKSLGCSTARRRCTCINIGIWLPFIISSAIFPSTTAASGRHKKDVTAQPGSMVLVLPPHVLAPVRPPPGQQQSVVGVVDS